jgi:glycine cleavage system H lipoate-binding protein
MPHDLLTLYTAKSIEYGIALLFLVLFVPFWRFAMGTARPLAHAAAARESWSDRLTHWFHVPDRTFFHPGHAWARVEGDGVVTLGIDDFAQKLVGQVSEIAVPPVGARLVQGEPAWTVAADRKAVDMVAPVGGTVLAVNERVLREPATVNQDPYGEGWLVKVRAPRAAAHFATLRAGQAARTWMDEVCESLSSSLTPALGAVYQDGGVPVDGLARAVAGEDWDVLARRFLLTDADDAPEPARAEPR